MTSPAPLDPQTPKGQQTSHDLGVLLAGVIARLRREGQPIPSDTR